MPKFVIPAVDADGEEIQPTCRNNHQTKKPKRQGTFLAKEILEAWYPRFPGSAMSKVFFLLFTRAARYGKGLVFLSIDEIAIITGLSKRAVEYAICRLKKGGFIRRESRYRISIPDPCRVERKANSLKLRFPETARHMRFQNRKRRNNNRKRRNNNRKRRNNNRNTYAVPILLFSLIFSVFSSHLLI
jgi:hypothetical protein